ncbi:hypothetical protein BD626DRAFT_629049 [Schizophyllum amplum]|uniref:Uncharacterized protein n=1 Tax=Schizophyllum amplum TaxID=97359 RepID=A0A550CJP1_9AGAR|nr:hypothetical protein BD626DRAFT_629049 [Auriculariopsis ampla]
MSTALIRAVQGALSEPTIENVFKAYLKEAGFDAFRLPSKANPTKNARALTEQKDATVPHDARHSGFEMSWQSDAVAAFERAMDKHPNDDRHITRIIRELRLKYWEEKPKDTYVRCRVCSCCGRLRPVQEIESREARMAIEGRPDEGHEQDKGNHGEVALARQAKKPTSKPKRKKRRTRRPCDPCCSY